MRALLLLTLSAIASPSLAQPLAGEAQAVDGDTLTIGADSVRLFGIDAPEATQRCTRDGEPWACGEASTRQLRALVANARVTCTQRGTDDYGRIIAVCSAAGLELNRTMVAGGWAVAYRRYSQDYVADETRARAARVGIWNASFMLPEDYRQAAASAPVPRPSASPVNLRKRTGSAPAVMGRCAIKGNRNRKGQWIYHLPGMPYYEATRAEEIFCTEADAQAAGYRRAIVR